MKSYNDTLIGFITSENRYYNWDEDCYVELNELDPSRYIMEFGKHKGKNLLEIDDEYIQWLRMNEPDNTFLSHCINAL